MMVGCHLRLVDGSAVEIGYSYGVTHKALGKAIRSRRMLMVQTVGGEMSVNPANVLYVKRGPVATSAPQPMARHMVDAAGRLRHLPTGDLVTPDEPSTAPADQALTAPFAAIDEDAWRDLGTDAPQRPPIQNPDDDPHPLGTLLQRVAHDARLANAPADGLGAPDRAPLARYEPDEDDGNTD